jgi:hypothetical protein
MLGRGARDVGGSGQNCEEQTGVTPKGCAAGQSSMGRVTTPFPSIGIVTANGSYLNSSPPFANGREDPVPVTYTVAKPTAFICIGSKSSLGPAARARPVSNPPNILTAHWNLQPGVANKTNQARVTSLCSVSPPGVRDHCARAPPTARTPPPPRCGAGRWPP